MPQRVAIVNASSVLSDAAARAPLSALQKQIDRDFLPSWEGQGAEESELIFIGRGKPVPADAWPIFLNRHSADPGALGWHTDENGPAPGGIFGRVFVGDCIHYGISWTVDLSHELLEMLADPSADRTWKMEDGREAALEVCDAVEADACAYKIGRVAVSDFVLPAYFGHARRGMKYDFGGFLKRPCPALTPGGYMSLLSNGVWSQVDAERKDALRGRRALRAGFRRSLRALKQAKSEGLLPGTGI